MSWSNDIVLEFLDLYRREQLLWDPKHPLHRNRSEISDAWHRIQTTLSIHCSVTDLKKKKESLMTSFRMHWNKKKKSPDYHTTWFAYPLMESFLCGKYECDSTQIEHEFFVNTAYTTPVIPDHTAPRNHSTVERTPTPRHSRQSGTQSNPIDPKTTGYSSDMFYAKKQMDEAVTYLKKATSQKRDMDEYDLYGQLLAKKLRKLDEHQRDMAMHEIDNIMFRAKMQGGPSQPRSYPSSPSPVPRKMKSPVFIVTQQSHGHYEDENISYQDHQQEQPPS